MTQECRRCVFSEESCKHGRPHRRGTGSRDIEPNRSCDDGEAESSSTIAGKNREVA